MAVIESYTSTDPVALFARLSRLVQAGGVIAVPTETYYGLGVNPFDAAAVGRLLSIKGRPDGKPILILIGEQAQLQDLVTSVPPVARVLMEAYWPGPLTLVLPACARLPESVTAGTGTVWRPSYIVRRPRGVASAYRSPDGHECQSLRRATGSDSGRGGADDRFTGRYHR